MKKIRIMSVFGTRPEAIKMAPLVKALSDSAEFESLLAVTAQHREMLDRVLELFRLRADYDLDIMKQKQTLTDITSSVLSGMEYVLTEAKPDLVLVHGDTTTTFSAALAAFYQKIPVGHVEAGLRSYSRYSPYPEELNRTLTGRLAELHFAPTATAVENLHAEGITRGIYLTGNTVIDALLSTVKKDYQFTDGPLAAINRNQRKILTVTAHRRENWGEPLENIFRALRRIKEDFSEVEIIFPVHKNPLVGDTAERILGGAPGIHLIEPLDYEPFANLLAASHLVLTDSGGLQEEAPALGKPVLVLRTNTERPEAVAAGTVELLGTDEDTIYSRTAALLSDSEKYRRMAEATNPYGDGKAADRIVEALRYHFGFRQDKPADWQSAKQ